MHEQREKLKAQICEARMKWINAERDGLNQATVDACRSHIVALVEELQTLNGRRPANVRKPSPVVASSAWVGDAPDETPASEGWWWWCDNDWTMPQPTWVKAGWGRPYTHDHASTIGTLAHRGQWRGRLAVCGASPTDYAHGRRHDNARIARETPSGVPCSALF